MDSSENSWWWKLPADIQADILSRLPGKTLISLKLVSWGWYDVISYLCIPRLAPPSPAAHFYGFIYHHRQREGIRPKSANRLWLAALRNLEKSDLEVSNNANFKVSNNVIRDRLCRDYQPEDIKDCCNGILLVVRHDKDGSVHYKVYNPTTRETIQVPPPPNSYHSHHDKTQCCFASLAFEPTKSLHYKIICTPDGNITNPLKVETFSSETGKWSVYVVNIDTKLDGAEWIHRSAYLDGHLYRLLKTNYLACIDEAKSSELLRVKAIELPNFRGDIIYFDENNCYGSIGISRRRLHYSTRDRNGSTLLVYMLKDDAGWLLKHIIPFDDLLANRSHPFFGGLERAVNMYRKEAWFNFYAFHPNCDCLFLITPNEMLFYFPKEKYLEKFHFDGGEWEIVLGENTKFPYSHCPVILQSAVGRTCRASLDQHEKKDNLIHRDQKLEEMHHLHPRCLVTKTDTGYPTLVKGHSV